MEGVVVGAVIGATLQVVLQKLLSLPPDETNDFKKDLAKLKSSFYMVHDFLHEANMQHVTDRAVIRWLRNLEALAFEADNVLDEISYQLLSQKMETITQQNKEENKVMSLYSRYKNQFKNYLTLGSQIRDINKKLELSYQQATAFGLQARLAGARAPDFGSHASASIETDSFTVDPIFIGRENDVLRIVKMLVTASPAQRVLSVLPIVGMGGLGKTTLARKMFSDQRIISHFEGKRVWVHVPRKFDKAVILKNILTSLTMDNVEHGNIEVLLKKLQYNLGPKKYLLVLDDVWNEEREKWDGFVNSLLGISSAVGNCVVVTTRSHEVASIVTTLDVHQLEGLPEDDCWSIIKAKTFNAGDDLVHQYETIGRNIAKRCQGLPLAAKVVGSLLCNKSREEWTLFEKNWFSNFGDEDPISKILKLSFDNLSLPLLKKCFAYCSIFPKGFEIKKENLIEIWMGEGFLQTGHNKNNMESTGNTFIEILLQQSLLQVAQRHRIYGYVTHCNMHDLVHDLALSILVGENNNNVVDETIQIRYIGYNSGGDIESLSNSKKEARYVRTLFFDGKVSDIGFLNFKSLRTLILSGREIGTLPTSIKELIHLRYLDTSETRIRYFPETLGELYHLETLRAQRRKWNRSYLEKLPESLKYLISLRHLHIRNTTTLPPEIGRLTSLQTLSHFHVIRKKGYGISELGSLTNLKGKLVIHNLENVRDKNEAMGADLCLKANIKKLALQWNKSDRELAEANEESVLEGLQPHPNLKRLTIGGFNGRRFPSWALKMEVRDDRGLNNLTKIKLENCRQVEEVPMLGHLPLLQTLALSNLENVRCIGSSFYGNYNRSSNEAGTIFVFRALERLTLLDMPNLREWAQVEFPPSEGHDHQIQPCQLVVFPRLKQLWVSGCRKLMNAPSNLKCLTHLRMYEMGSGLPLENICGGKLNTLQVLVIKRIGVERLPDGLFSNNHNLSHLFISGCLNLRELPDGLHTLKYLKALFIRGCPNLKPRAPYESQTGGFNSLCELGISHCKGLNNFSVEILKSCLESLDYLSFFGVIGPTNVQILMECLLKMPSLTSLGLGHSSSDDSCSWKDDASFNQFVGSVIFQTSKLSLRNFRLKGMSHWECLPDQIQHLTSLCSLQLELIGFGMEALPEWIGNMTSLWSLHLQNCKNLHHLPSKGAMQCLTKLTCVSIVNCPLLLKDRSNEDEVPQIVDSEWTKISHIPQIVVDGRPITYM